MSIVEKIIRNNIRNLVPYSTARDEYSGEQAVFLDANENPFYTGVNRYPDPSQSKLKVKISQIKNISYERIFLGNGSDEAMDLLIRAFCEPGIDNVVSIKPTYGMYKVLADIHDTEFREVLLTGEYQLDKEALLKVADLNSTMLTHQLHTKTNTKNRLSERSYQCIQPMFFKECHGCAGLTYPGKNHFIGCKDLLFIAC